MPLRLSTELSMADLWTGFDLNEPGAEDDDDAAAFDVDEHDAAAFDLDEHDAAAFDLNMPLMEDQNNNGNDLNMPPTPLR